MLDFPIDDLLDQEACLAWLERHLHPEGMRCPRCGVPERRPARRTAAFPAYRCKQCDRFYTVLTGTRFAKTRQTPAKLVLILRGIAKGEPTARLARELGLSRRQMHTLRQRVQGNLYESLPTTPMTDTVFEADELYQNAGKKGKQASRSGRSASPPCQ
jgi:transposase-like protein